MQIQFEYKNSLLKHFLADLSIHFVTSFINAQTFDGFPHVLSERKFKLIPN